MNVIEKIALAVFIVIVCCLIAVGVIISYSASAYDSYLSHNNDMYYLKSQIYWLIISVVTAVIVGLCPLKLIEKISLFALIMSIIILIMVYLPGLGDSAKGARRWLSIPLGIKTFRFQPSEFAKIGILMFNAWWLSRYKKHYKEFFMGSFFPIVIAGIPIALIAFQPDFGIPAIILTTLLAVIFINGAKIVNFGIMLLMGIGFSTFLIIGKTYRLGRLHDFFFFEPSGQILESLIAISSGGMYGLGIGNSIAKLRYLPEAHTDFIFAIFAEEFGFCGTFSLLLLYFILMLAMFVLLKNVTNLYGKLLGSSIMILFFIQTIINIGVVSQLLPTKGFTLPLISCGGSSLLSWFILFGLFYNITCREKRNKNFKKQYSGVR